MAVINQYHVGSKPRLTATFKLSGTLTDPGGPTFRILPPSGAATVYVYPTDAQLVKDSTGIFHVDWPIPTTGKGNWWYRFEGTDPVQDVQETYFVAKESRFF